jgi:hypothetical protein
MAKNDEDDRDKDVKTSSSEQIQGAFIMLGQAVTSIQSGIGDES